MAIADEKVKIKTHRVTLVTLSPARDLSDLLTAIGGGLYSYTFNGAYDVFKVERNGVELTQVFGTPTSDDEWYINPLDGQFTIKLAASPRSSVPFNVIMVYYNIYLKDNETFDRALDTYVNRITRSPRFRQSVSNIYGGVITIAKQTLGISNADQWFSQYLTRNDYYYNKNISVKFRINNVELTGFVGKMSDFSVTQNEVNIDILDLFVGLQDTASLGDSDSEIYHRTSGVFYKDYNRPIKYFIKSSNFAWLINKNLTTTDPNSYPCYSIDIDKCEKAVCSDYSALITSTNNRTWILGRGPDIKTYNFGTIIDIDCHGSGNVYGDMSDLGNSSRAILEFRSSDSHNLEVGDTFTIQDNIPVVHQAIIIHVPNSTNTYGGKSYYAMVTTKAAPASLEDWTGNTISQINSPAIIIKQHSDGKEFICQNQYDYTLNSTVTTGGNKLYSITFNNGFEGNATHNGLLNTISPDTHDIYFKLTTTQDPHNVGISSKNYDVESVLVKLFSSIGLVYDTVNSGDFSPFRTDLMFSIPYYDQSQYQTYLEYIEKIMVGLPAYSYIDAESSKVIAEYIYIGSDEQERSDENIYAISTKLDSSNVYTTVVVSSKYSHRFDSLPSYQDYTGNIREEVFTYKDIFYKTGIVRTKNLDVLLENPLGTLFSYLSYQIYKLKYKIGMIDIDSTIGKRRTITSKYAVGHNGTINGNSGIRTIITSIDVGTDEIDIEAISI